MGIEVPALIRIKLATRASCVMPWHDERHQWKRLANKYVNLRERTSAHTHTHTTKHKLHCITLQICDVVSRTFYNGLLRTCSEKSSPSHKVCSPPCSSTGLHIDPPHSLRPGCPAAETVRQLILLHPPESPMICPRQAAEERKAKPEPTCPRSSSPAFPLSMNLCMSGSPRSVKRSCTRRSFS